MGVITVTKELIGVEDINWYDGTATFSRTTSTGGTQTVNKISGKDVPVEDTNSIFTATDVENVLVETYTRLRVDGTGTVMEHVEDEDDMASNSATKLVTQQSAKAYVDTAVDVQAFDNLDIVENNSIVLIFAFDPDKIIIVWTLQLSHDTTSEPGQTQGYTVVTIAGTDNATFNTQACTFRDVNGTPTVNTIQDDTAYIISGYSGHDGTDHGQLRFTETWNTATKTLTLIAGATTNLDTSLTFLSGIATAYRELP